ncbi:hypothetical protein STAS_29206 [Striga asiatica]|uniref:Uncharacterized protein n=1 Tax=Striga asiatica TaxID=4170 RepID=A0A5A7R2Z6_STRAF|nr:hypothetical protein STAS_29206 [Striga asiatica]
MSGMNESNAVPSCYRGAAASISFGKTSTMKKAKGVRFRRFPKKLDHLSALGRDGLRLALLKNLPKVPPIDVQSLTKTLHFEKEESSYVRIEALTSTHLVRSALDKASKDAKKEAEKKARQGSSLYGIGSASPETGSKHARPVYFFHDMLWSRVYSCGLLALEEVVSVPDICNEYGCGRLRDDHDEYAGPGNIGSNGFGKATVFAERD